MLPADPKLVFSPLRGMRYAPPTAMGDATFTISIFGVTGQAGHTPHPFKISNPILRTLLPRNLCAAWRLGLTLQRTIVVEMPTCIVRDVH